jgi:hypothetical protein
MINQWQGILYDCFGLLWQWIDLDSTKSRLTWPKLSCVVQLQAPLFVETKMTMGVAVSRKPRGLFSRLMMPTSNEYARAAACWIGHGPLCMPNLGHRLQWFICHVIPDLMLDVLVLRVSLWHRVIFQRLRTTRSSRPSVINDGVQSQKQA